MYTGRNTQTTVKLENDTETSIHYNPSIRIMKASTGDLFVVDKTTPDRTEYVISSACEQAAQSNIVYGTYVEDDRPFVTWVVSQKHIVRLVTRPASLLERFEPYKDVTKQTL